VLTLEPLGGAVIQKVVDVRAGENLDLGDVEMTDGTSQDSRIQRTIQETKAEMERRR
jgi:hypothetical protein